MEEVRKFMLIFDLVLVQKVAMKTKRKEKKNKEEIVSFDNDSILPSTTLVIECIVTKIILQHHRVC